jgi:hypothetical protein
LLQEYQSASNGKVVVEIVDHCRPDKEAEANKLRPQPTPCRRLIATASVVNACFDILVRYGDQNVVLNFGT